MNTTNLKVAQQFCAKIIERVHQVCDVIVGLGHEESLAVMLGTLTGCCRGIQEVSERKEDPMSASMLSRAFAVAEQAALTEVRECEKIIDDEIMEEIVEEIKKNGS